MHVVAVRLCVAPPPSGAGIWNSTPSSEVKCWVPEYEFVLGASLPRWNAVFLRRHDPCICIRDMALGNDREKMPTLEA